MDPMIPMHQTRHVTSRFTAVGLVVGVDSDGNLEIILGHEQRHSDDVDGDEDRRPRVEESLLLPLRTRKIMAGEEFVNLLDTGTIRTTSGAWGSEPLPELPRNNGHADDAGGSATDAHGPRRSERGQVSRAEAEFLHPRTEEIGRASCVDRVCVPV